MKYLKKRDDYLNCIQQSKRINEIYRKEIDNLQKINEEAPFENDINFGDSLLGRLINSAMRKAAIGIKITRIGRCIDRLKSAFDDILLSSITQGLTKEEKNSLAKVLISSYIRAIQEAVNKYGKNEGTLDEIKNLTSTAIEYVETNKEAEDLADRSYILQQLKQFKDFLDKFKEIEGEDEESTDVSSKLSIFGKNFMSLARLFKIYAQIKSGANRPVNKPEENKPEVNAENKPETTGQNKPEVNAENKSGEEPDNGKVNVPESGIEGKTESRLFKYKGFLKSIFEAEESPKQDSPMATNPQTPEIIEALKKLYETLSKEGEEGASKMIKEVLESDLDEWAPETRGSLKRIYAAIRKANGLEEKIIESVLSTFLLENEKILKDIIIEINKASKQGPVPKGFIENEELLANLNAELETFKSTMEDCLDPDLYKKEGGAENESLSYSMYQLILEKKIKNRKEVVDYWNNEIDLNKFAVTQAEADKIKNAIEKEAAKRKDAIDIQGYDPVIEIVKIFNRAYKLHTTSVIQSGRSGGKVSNSVFLEYEAFNSSASRESAGSSGGPYRHIATFNKWENAVLDIMKERKYQPIFNTGTRMKVGDEYIAKAGANLRKFMTDLLDGEKLYGGGKTSEGGGAQKDFLNKYFGWPGDSKELGYTRQELDDNRDNRDGIKDIKIKFISADSEIKNEEDNTTYKNPDGLLFRLEEKAGSDTDKYWYMIVIGPTKVTEQSFVILSRSVYYINKIIKKSLLGDSKWEGLAPLNSTPRHVYYAKIKTSNFWLDSSKVKKSSIKLSGTVFEKLSNSGTFDINADLKETTLPKEIEIKDVKIAMNISDENAKKAVKCKGNDIKEIYKIENPNTWIRENSGVMSIM